MEMGLLWFPSRVLLAHKHWLLRWEGTRVQRLADEADSDGLVMLSQHCFLSEERQHPHDDEKTGSPLYLRGLIKTHGIGLAWGVLSGKTLRVGGCTGKGHS